MTRGDISRRVFVAGAAGLLVAAKKRPPKVDAPQARAFVMSASYRGSARLMLPNTQRDGDLVAGSLRRLRFAAVLRVSEASPQTFAQGFAAFLKTLTRDSIAFIYLCGHGVQVGGRNYILLEDGATYVGIVSMIEAARRSASEVVLLLDACRNNPFRGAPAADSGEDAVPLAAQAFAAFDDLGFLEVSYAIAPEGRLSAFQLQGSGVKVVFATDPQNVALDGVTVDDVNSPFATAVAKRLAEKKSFDDIVAIVTGDVVAATGGDQSPWSQGSLGRPIFLAGPPPNVNPARVPFNVPG